MPARRGARAPTAKPPRLVDLSHLSPALCRLTPIAGGRVDVHDCCMVQLAIRCQPRIPVAAGELEGWLELEVHELRKAAPHGRVRLSRLTQGGPSADLEIGWLIELELADGDPLVGGQRLADVLRDMRLLGLEPTLLAPRDASANGRAA